jgi:urease accessory protein
MRDDAAPIELQRAHGRADVAVHWRDGEVRLDRLFQQGCAKARFPRPSGAAPEAVLINTAGGVTGGDRITWRLEAGRGGALVATSQAAERVYRSSGGAARIETRLTLGEGARLDWLPQETIVFDGGRLERSLDADLAPDASLLALEAVVLGRAERGESVVIGTILDRWRIRRGGRLVHAEALRLDGDVARATGGVATLGGGRAFATVVAVAAGAGARVGGARRALVGLDGVSAAASAKGEDVVVVRMLAAEAQALRAGLIRFLMRFRDAPLPRVWTS